MTVGIGIALTIGVATFGMILFVMTHMLWR